MSDKNNKPNVHYIHYLDQSAREQLVGAFFIITLLIIISLVIVKINSAKMFDKTITYHAYMKNAQGISTETLVNISGIEVGKVAAIDIADDNKIHIEFFIYKSFEKLIRLDSIGELSKLSLVGNAIIIINAGTPSRPLLPEGSTIRINEPITTDDLIEGIKPVINDLETTMASLADIVAVINPESIQTGSKSLISVMENLEHITDQISSGQGAIGKSVYDQQQAQQLSNALNTFTIALSKIGPLIENLTELSAESRFMVSDVRRSLNKIDRELEHLPEMVNETQMLIQSTEETVHSVQQLWPLSTITQQSGNELLINEGALHD